MLKNKVTALIVAAGTGERFGASVPKQYLPLMGVPLLKRTVQRFLNHPGISDVRIIINPLHEILFKTAMKDMRLSPAILGGDTRQDSVRKGLEALASQSPDIVLIHDAVRPFVDDDLIDAALKALEGKTKGAIPALPVTDTLKKENAGFVAGTQDRSKLYAAQTPQAFVYQDILSAHQKFKDSPATDDAQLMELAGFKVALVDGNRKNIKITTQDDLTLAETYLMSDLIDIRTATGFDVHRFIPAPHGKIRLCGIDIAHTHKLDGHSDADVGLHAITDALLGTICDGDIGSHFSPKDNRWKDADSTVFLKHAGDLVAAKGGVISHIDVTLICELPKITPHRDAMRAKIAQVLGLKASQISVKATTTEGLGFTGRSEGIAANAVATVRLPLHTEQQSMESKQWASSTK